MDDRQNDNEVPEETTCLLQDDQAKSGPKTGGAWFEIQLLLQQSPPLFITYLLQFFPGILNTLIAGHLSADDLAASAIGGTTAAISGLAFVQGMATALDTLCAQTYGAGDLPGVGLHIQKMALLMVAACIPIGTVWIMSPWLLTFVVNQPHLAVKAGGYIRMSLLGLPAQALYETVKRFLQVQGDFHTAMTIITICTPVNVFLSWFFAIHLGMGLDGVALGSSLSQVLRATLLITYIVVFAKWSHGCWNGFSRDAFRNWRRMIELSISGSITILSEYAAFEILTFCTSYVSPLHLAAQSILTTISITAWNLPFSVSVVVSDRIGQLVGAGQIKPAQRAALIHGLTFVVLGCASGIITLLLRNHLPRIFTNDEDVLELCAQTIVAVAFLQFAESVMCGTNGILRGLGRQSFAALTVIAINYLSVVPLSIWLEIGSPHWGLMGFWIGLPTGMVIIASIQILYMNLIDWGKCVEDARKNME